MLTLVHELFFKDKTFLKVTTAILVVMLSTELFLTPQ